MGTDEMWFGELRMGDTHNAVVADLNVLLEELSDHPPQLSLHHLRTMLATGTRLFAARHGVTVVGAALLVPTTILMGRKWWVEDVMVLKSYHRQHIATQLMDMVEAAARNAGATQLNLTSSTRRTAARTLYTRRGYVERDTNVYRLTF